MLYDHRCLKQGQILGLIDDDSVEERKSFPHGAVAQPVEGCRGGEKLRKDAVEHLGSQRLDDLEHTRHRLGADGATALPTIGSVRQSNESSDAHGVRFARDDGPEQLGAHFREQRVLAVPPRSQLAVSQRRLSEGLPEHRAALRH